MFKPSYLISALLLWVSSVAANQTPLLTAPLWLERPAENLLLDNASSIVGFTGLSQQTAFLPAGQWLDLPHDVFSYVTLWQGQTLNALRKLSPHELVCHEHRCQLPAATNSSFVVFKNKQDYALELEVWQGSFHAHRDPFRRAVKLPLQVKKLSLGQDHETYYELNPNQHVTQFFPNATKLKLSVRKDMFELDAQGKVSVTINGQPSSIINLTNRLAEEYPQQHIGLVNVDYIAVPKDSYLTIKSHGAAFIKLESMHRAIYDTDAGQKQLESQFNPYWVNNLEPALEDIYRNGELDRIANFAPEMADSLALRRYQDLVSTVSTRRYAKPAARNDRITTTTQRIFQLHGARKAALQLLDIENETSADTYTLTDTLTFDLSFYQRIRDQLVVYLRSYEDTELVVQYGEQRYPIKLKASEQFNRIVLPVKLEEKYFTLFSADESHIELAVQVDDLLELPNNELLYATKDKLEQKSPTILAQLETIEQRTAKAYLNSLPDYKSVRAHVSAPKSTMREAMYWQNKLAEAMSLSIDNPIQALPILKILVHSNIPSVVLDAWRIRIHLLEQLDRESTALSYLEGLLSSPYPNVQTFAASELLTRYTQSQQIYKVQGLCAAAPYLTNKCQALVGKILLAQQKYLQALWRDHDMHHSQSDTQALLAHSNYRTMSQAQAASYTAYEVSHFGSLAMQGETTDYLAYPVEAGKSITIRAKSDITLQVRIRTPFLHTGTTHDQWVHLDTSSTQSILPVFADIASTTELVHDETRLSIASEGIISLQQGEQLTVNSKYLNYLSFSILGAHHSHQDLLVSQLSEFKFATQFTDLVNDSDVDLRTLLTNALYRLDEEALNHFEFTLLFAKLENVEVPKSLATLASRVKNFGTWQPLKQYHNYAGTQLVDMDAISRRSLAEQLSRHTSQHVDLSGLLIRPHHTLHLDLSQLQSQQVKLQFTFATAELLPEQHATVLIESSSNPVLWPVSYDQQAEYALTRKELSSGLITLRWTNPYLSQLLSVKVRMFHQGRWQDAPIDARQLFYFATPAHPIEAKLHADSLIKIERLEGNTRVEKVSFHPAGKLELPGKTNRLARIFTWQLKPNRTKLSVAPPSNPIIVEKPAYMRQQQAIQFYDELVSMDENLTHVEGFMRYNRAGIFENEQVNSARHTADFGIRLRNKDKQHWYRLESFYTMDNQNYDTFSINGSHSWLDEEGHWFTQASFNNRWQDDTPLTESHITTNIRFRIGEIWRDDTTHRHAWWWQPFYYYTSIDAPEYIRDRDMSPSMFSFYREDHRHGWQASYEYRYQPWVDNLLSASVRTTSNQDWTSFDSLTFNLGVDQYFEGQIFSAALQSSYKFADDHRPNDTWQYLTQLSWQTLFDFSENTGGWLKLSWTQDWFRNDHSLRFEVNLGNLQQTGFGPFAHDEILFKSLQLSHFLEQDIYDQ